MRKNSNYVDSKVITFSIVGVALLATVVFGILMYGKNVDNNVKSSQLSTEQIASIAENNEEEEKELEKVNSDLGKSVEEAEKEATKKIEEEKKVNAEIKENDKNSKTTSTPNSVTTKETPNSSNNVETSAKATKNETIVRKELEFQKPVEGEITQKYAKDGLIYSNTLAEWVTHLGIDIKADKTTVVNSAEDGIVKSIKNDPRYGLTIVVSHQDGFETLYANLLSSEFVKEGDKVTKGQAIGTVGNTGVFESAEEPHLHFEILKDSVQVDPSIYLK